MGSAIIPEAGIRESVPAVEYHRWEACSSSRLKWIARSPASCRYRLDHPKSTSAMTLGTAAHMAILEPGLFATRCVCRPTKDDGTVLRANSNAHKEWEAGLPADSIVLSPEHYDAARGMRDAVRKHPAARGVLAIAQRREVSAVWTDPDTGLLCKCRPDMLGDGQLADVKTTGLPKGLDEDSLSNWIVRNMLDMQAAFYADGMGEVTGNRHAFAWIVVMSDPPHEVAIVPLTDDMRRSGRAIAADKKKSYARCIAAGEWPGGPSDPIEVNPPDWHLRKLFPEEYAPAKVELTAGGKPMEGF